MDVIKTSDSSEAKHKCDWRGCTSSHDTPVTYGSRSDGEVDKKYPIVGYWPHPSTIYKQNATLINEVKDKEGKIIRFKPLNRLYNYRTQRHHVIPANILKDHLKDLAYNLSLLGWNMNDGLSNGMRCTWYDRDIAWHDLQIHLGPHTTYDMVVFRSLSNIERACRKYCKTNVQHVLLKKIEGKVLQFRQKIKAWEVILNSRSLSLRGPS